MPKSATDVMGEIVFSAVIDAMVALKGAAGGLPNALWRDVSSVHANTTTKDLPPEVQAAIAASVRTAFAKFRQEGYTVAPQGSVTPERRPDQTRPPRPKPAGPPTVERRRRPIAKPPGKPGGAPGGGSKPPAKPR